MATNEADKKVDVDDIFHPLATLNSHFVESETKPRFRYDARPVPLKDAIYIQGGTSNSSEEEIWKYSITKGRWSPPIHPPQDADNYTIFEYRSQLLLIGGKYNESAMKIYRFDKDSGWSEEEDIKPPFNIGSPSSMVVASEQRFLTICWVNDNQFKMLIFDGKNWRKVKGPECKTGFSRPNMIAHNGTLYLSDCNHDSIYSVPLKSLVDSPAWNKYKLPDIPRKQLLTSGAANLTILNSSCLATIVPSKSTSYKSIILAFEPHTKTWTNLGEIDWYLDHDTKPPQIIGFPSGSVGNIMLLVVGWTKRQGEQGIIDLFVRNNSFGVLKVSSTVKTYNPDDELSLCALMKFERCPSYNLKVLTELEKSYDRREKFTEKANFTLINQFTQTDLCPGVESAAMCIESWLSTSKSKKPPSSDSPTCTWNNFLRILKEIELDDIAQGIEQYLTATTMTHPEGIEYDTEIQSTLVPLESVPECSTAGPVVSLASGATSPAAEPHTTTPRQNVQSGPSTGPLQSQQHTATASAGPSLHPPSPKRQCSRSEQSSQIITATLTGLLSINDLGSVLEAVWEARSKWYNMGLKLGTSPGTLDAIKTAAKENPDDCITAMIKDWLNNGNPRPTWAAVVSALKSPMVGYGHLADKLPPHTTKS